MFSKDNRKSGPRYSAPSIVGADCAVTGDILSQGELHIDGRVDGDIRCNVLVIGESGTITGEISAETVTVLGSVTGQITARIVALSKTARILGDITHDSLSVEAGAYVEGRFDRLPSDSAVIVQDRSSDSSSLRNQSGQALLSAAKRDEADVDPVNAGVVQIGN
jgi:cytoskeletal protein CcmA (bactofilin family)